MRVKFSDSRKRDLLFCEAYKNKSRKDVAAFLKTSSRTLNDWEKGRLTIPDKAFKKLLTISTVNLNSTSFEILPDQWHIKAASRKGGLMRIKLHGSPGTPAGRRRGGINSIISHKNHPGNFKLLKSFKKPKDSSKLAELLGILIGDGHLSNYQVLITTNSETDMDHALFVKNLIQGLFGLSVHVRTRKNEKTVNLVVSSKGLVEFLNTKGMPIGNKIKKGIGVPSWIKSKLAYKRSFLKGLFDTDGCVYIDSHKTKNRIYRHFGWTITSYADTLLEEIIGVLGELGFTPTQRASQKSVFLRKQGEIKKYFESIGTHNPKHYDRFWRSTEVVITGRSRKPL